MKLRILVYPVKETPFGQDEFLDTYCGQRVFWYVAEA